MVVGVTWLSGCASKCRLTPHDDPLHRWTSKKVIGWVVVSAIIQELFTALIKLPPPKVEEGATFRVTWQGGHYVSSLSS